MNNRAFLLSLRIAALATLTMALQGCGKLYKENMDDCYGGVSVILRVDPATSGASEAEAAVQHAVIFVFDTNGHFLERRETQVNKEEMLWYPDHRELSVVGWLNKYEKYSVTEFTNGTTRPDGRVILSPVSRAVTECDIPTDLFYGDTEVITETGSRDLQQREINAGRRVGSMIVTVRGLREYAKMFDNYFYITVSPTYSAVDFYGEYCECSAAHTPSTAFNSSGEFITSNFNMLPTGDEDLTISIHHKDAGLIYQTSTDKSGSKISVVADRTENVLIDFTAFVEVSVLRSLWGEVHIWGKDIQ